jgi:hypothetical protein
MPSVKGAISRQVAEAGKGIMAMPDAHRTQGTLLAGMCCIICHIKGTGNG